MDGMKKPAYKLPGGYDDEAAFLQEARERFQEGVDADRLNRDAGLDDLRFISGEQWDEQVKATRQRNGRPCLTINTLPQYIGQVIGDMRTNRPSIKVRPAEDSDKPQAEARQGLIRYIENACNALQAYSLAGEDQVSCGIGNFRVGLEYASDDSFDQDIRISHIPNPFNVVWDPMSVDATGVDANWCFVVDEMPTAEFKRVYPDAAESGLTVPLDKGDWVSRDVVRVTEYWLIKEEKRKLALVQTVPDAQPQVMDITDEKGAEAFVVAGPDGKPRMREVLRKSACMYLINGHAILEGPYELPIKRLPIFRVKGREVRVGNDRYRFGLVRFAKDSARIKNLMRSAAMEWVAMAPKSQWLLNGANEKSAKAFRNAHKTGDAVLIWEGSADQKPERVDPPVSPAALLQEAQFNDQDIKDVTGLHDASLGMRSNETSGKAILARERQGDVATFMYHDNLNAAIREAGRVVNDLLPVIYDTARTITIIGDDDAAKVQRVNDPMDQGSIDLKSGKYDIVVETGPSYSTKRVEAAEQMTAFFQAVPTAGQVAGDLLAKAQDWPMADDIAERLKRMVPPNIAGPKDPKDMTPEDQQAAQMAQQQAQMAQQMQQEVAQLELAGKRADVAKAEAEAREAQAKARVAEAEAQMLPLEEMDRVASLNAKINPPEPDMPRAGADRMAV
jgi:hypothetical protein